MPDNKKNVSLDPEIEKEIETIYNEPGTAARDMTRLVQAKHSLARKILIGALVFFAGLTVISWTGFLFFSGPSEKFSGEGVELLIDGPGEVTGGAATAYVVRYRNGERLPLGTATLELRLPKEFILEETEPQTDKTTWRLGSIAPGKEGSVTVRGVMLAPKGQPLDFQAILTYRPADFNSEFQKVRTRTVAVQDSIIDLTIDGPAKAMPGDQVTFAVKYRNNSERDVEQIKIKAAYPPAFIPETAEPRGTENGLAEWLIPLVKAGAEGSIAVTGSFASSAQGKIELGFSAGFLDQDDGFMLQREAVFASGVVKGDLVTTLILGGKAEDQQVGFGDTLRYAIGYKNSGESTLGGVTLTLVIDAQPAPGAMVRWDELKDAQSGTRTENSVTWTSKQVSGLGTIKPGQEGSLEVDLPILAAPLPGASDYLITSWIESSLETVDGDKVGRTAKSQPIVAKIASDAAITEEARYFNADGIPVGSGPLPPKVGEKTTYRVAWMLVNSLHELADLKVSVPLPENVVWTGASNVDAGDLRFDAAAGKLVWTLNRLPTSIKKLGASFDVAITPTPEQSGKIPTLVDALIFEATDRATGGSILLSQPPLTTALENDPGAAGKGRVTE